jgi:hypothetical protein
MNSNWLQMGCNRRLGADVMSGHIPDREGNDMRHELLTQLKLHKTIAAASVS